VRIYARSVARFRREPWDLFGADVTGKLRAVMRTSPSLNFSFQRPITAGLLAFVLGLFGAGSQAAPDEVRLGRSLGYPVGTAATWFTQEALRVGSFTHQAEIEGLMNGGVHQLSPSALPMPLRRADHEPPFRWHIDARRNLGVEDYLARQRVMGLLVIKDDVIQLERYQYQRGPADRFLSHSVAKSLLSLGIGLALHEGVLSSLDDQVQRYVPGLKASLYGQVSLRQLLRMSSGVRFAERYDGSDDLELFGRSVAQLGVEGAAARLDQQAAVAGERFNYASSDSLVLALVLRAATGVSLSEYLQARLWQALGAEGPALWRTDRMGLELASGNFNAGLRDYGRLGVLLAHDGQRPDTGQQVLPRAYLQEATLASRHPPWLAPGQATPYFGYGYQFWIFPGKPRRFAMLGIFGQMVFVDPGLKLVMVQMSANATPLASQTSLAREADAFWRGLLAYYGASW